MEIFVESWTNAQTDHCWLDESCSEDYVDDSTCCGCGTAMEALSEVLNSHGEIGLVSGLCPCCGFVKRTRNLSNLYENIKAHGYRPWHFRNSFVGGVFLERADGPKR